MLEQELAFAHEMGDAAGEIAMRYYLGEFEVKQKPDLSPVTEADIAVEAMFREVVAQRFPSDSVLGEEGGLTGASDRVWVIDPIDGTKNFADGVPVWATLIALQIEGKGVLGLTSSPALGERYEAVRGHGARWNGRDIHVSRCDRVSRAFVNFSSVDTWLVGPRREEFLDLLAGSRRNRGFGDFWGHMLVARGAADVMLEQDLALWDWAALQVIVEEAGGRVTTLDGDPPFDGGSILTTNGLIHDEVMARLRGPVSRS